MKMVLKKELSQKKIILLVVPGQTFNDSLLKVVKGISKKNVCYVTLNKGFNSLIDSFKRKKISLKNFFFVDCITATLVKQKSDLRCLYVSSPNALTELCLVITKSVDLSSPTVLIDSLSTLQVYHKTGVISRFVNRISQDIRKKEGAQLILAISDKDKDTKLFSQIEVLVDKVVEV